MILQTKNIDKALNKAYLAQNPYANEINLFKEHYTTLLKSIQQTDNEETLKDYINDFLKNTYYKGKFFTKENVNNIDLSILTGNNADDKIAVIIETKAIKNVAEMITENDLNKKAFYELIQYYLEERISNSNIEIKHLIITNSIEWFIFNATEFERIFYQNKQLQKNFIDWNNGKLVSKNKEWFYNEITKPFVETSEETIVCTHFILPNIVEFQNLTDFQLIHLYKIFSPEHLLKLPFANDSNTLNQDFYNELLHILGLYETKDNSRTIERLKENNRNEGSLLENVISIIENDDILQNIEDTQQYGETKEEQIFSIALELSVTWVNRIIFLKLLESQLLRYNNNNPAYKFLNSEIITDFEIVKELFFEVLAKKTDERKKNITENFKNIPYLNSSLFEATELERTAVKINHLKQHTTLPFFSQTVLKNENEKRIAGAKPVLNYLLDFLDSYNFASDKRVEIQEKNKTLINSSVLGLIFEKLNGYKEGSFFTPGYVTMYICRDTIRNAVIQKFRDSNLQEFKNLTNFTDLYNQIGKISLPQANQIFNTIRICDPAVGSGHFLVSALNELIAIKSELGILIDCNGQLLRNTYCEVENDELYITHFGDFFVYNFKDRESQRIQETIFNEKRILIENCLFGVDINPKSVQICRLRLWIELLKNAYYVHTQGFAYQQLETLPNIDINIKCGNSLVSFFNFNGSTFKNGQLSKIQQFTKEYKTQVKFYKEESDKKAKDKIVEKIKQLKNDFMQYANPNDKDYKELKLKESEHGSMPMFFSHDDQVQWQIKQAQLFKEISELQNIIDHKNKTLYANAFEWRFEFPEVLDDNGNLVGFDVVIGNPPYFSVSKLNKNFHHYFQQNNYQTYSKSTDIYCLFFELAHRILTKGGICHYITSSQWLQTEYGIKLREFFVQNTNPISLFNLGGYKVFEKATVDTAIFAFNKEICKSEMKICLLKNEKYEDLNLSKYFADNHTFLTNLSTEKWSFENENEKLLRKKIKKAGKPLKDWNIEINYGVKTGFNEAYIIDEKTKNEIIYRGIITGLNEAFIIDEKTRQQIIEQDKKSHKIIKPLLRGRDLRKYGYNYAGLYLIHTHNGLKQKNIKPINVQKDYPAIYEHLKKYQIQLEKREDQGDHWSNLRNCTYFEKFDEPKLIYPETTGRRGEFFVDTSGIYLDKTCFMITGEHLYYFNAILSSKLMEWYLEGEARLLGKQGIQYSKRFIELVPIPVITEKEETKFVELITSIYENKKKQKDIKKYEDKINLMVYKLYDLTKEEIEIIENETA